jgi:hypothetical protein
MSKIKLLKLDELSDGTQRFQSQLFVGRGVADFIMETDGTMKCYGRSFGFGFDFYPYNKPYEIVTNKSDMLRQEL